MMRRGPKLFFPGLICCQIVVLVCGFSAFASSQNKVDDKPFVAIGAFQSRDYTQESADWAGGLTELLTIELAQSDKIVLLDRSVISGVIDEFSLAYQGVTDRKKFEKIATPDMILTGRYYQTENTRIVVTRLVDTESGLLLAGLRIEFEKQFFEPVIAQIKDFVEEAVTQQASPSPEYLVAVTEFADNGNSDDYLYYGNEIREFLIDKFSEYPSVGVATRSQMAPLLQEQRLREIVLIQSGQRITPLPGAALLVGGSYEVTPQSVIINFELDTPGYMTKNWVVKASSLEACLAQASRELDEIIVLAVSPKEMADQDAVRSLIEEGVALGGPHLKDIGTNVMSINFALMGLGERHLATPKSEIAENLNKAVDRFRKALKLDPNNETATFYLGLCLIRKEINAIDEGRKCLEKVIWGSADDRRRKVAAHFLPKSPDFRPVLYQKEGVRPEPLAHLNAGMKRSGLVLRGEVDPEGLDWTKDFPPRITTSEVELTNTREERKRKRKKGHNYNAAMEDCLKKEFDPPIGAIMANRVVSERKRRKNLLEAIDHFEAALFLDSRNFKAMEMLAFCLQDPAVAEMDRANQLFKCVVNLSKQDDYTFIAANALGIVDQITFSTLFDSYLKSSRYQSMLAERQLEEAEAGDGDLSLAYDASILAACGKFEKKSVTRPKAPFSLFADLSEPGAENELSSEERKRILAKVWEKYPRTAPHLILACDLNLPQIRAEMADALNRVANLENDIYRPEEFNNKLADKFSELDSASDNAAQTIGSYLREARLLELIAAYDNHQKGFARSAVRTLSSLMPRDAKIDIAYSGNPVSIQDLSALTDIAEPERLFDILVTLDYLDAQGMPTEKWFDSDDCYTHSDKEKLRAFHTPRYGLCRQLHSQATIKVTLGDGTTFDLKPNDTLQTWRLAYEKFGENPYTNYALRHAHSPKVKTRFAASEQTPETLTPVTSDDTGWQETFETEESEPTSFPGFPCAKFSTQIGFSDRMGNNITIRAAKFQTPRFSGRSVFQPNPVSCSGNYLVVGDSTKSGRAFVFRHDRGEWTPEAILSADPKSTSRTYFNGSVAISDDMIVVGAQWEADQGPVRPEDFQGVAVEIESLFEKLFQLGYLDVRRMTTDKVRQIRPGTCLSNLEAAISHDFPEYSRPIPWKIAKTLCESSSVKDCGAAYVFKRENGKWVWKQKLTAFDALEENKFGSSVAISGDTLLVGASGRFSMADHLYKGGGLYLFQRQNGEYEFQKKLTDYKVNSLSMSGDHIVVGTTPRDGTQLERGAQVLVYKREQDGWSLQTRLRPKDYTDRNDAFAMYGATVAIDGDRIAVGNLWDNLGDRKNGRRGSVYIFERNGDTWREQQKLTAKSLGRPFKDFGTTVSIFDDLLLVGGQAEIPEKSRKKTTVAVLYGHENGEWTEKQFYQLFRNNRPDMFASMALAVPGQMVIASPYEQREKDYDGSIYFFRIPD